MGKEILGRAYCTQCGKEYPAESKLLHCPECGGLIIHESGVERVESETIEMEAGK